MDILLSTGSLAPRSLTIAAKIARDAGADGLELLLNNALLASGPEQAARAATAHAMPIRSVHPPIRLIGAEHYVHEDMIAAAAFARGLADCRTLVMHAIGGAGLHTERGRAFLDTVTTVGETLGQSGVRLSIENRGTVQPKPKLDFLDKLPNLYRVCEEWDLGIVLDTSHAASYGLNIVAALDVVGGSLTNIHLSDRRAESPAWISSVWNSLAREHQLPGTGALPLGAFLRKLRSRQYRGAVTLELSPLALASWSTAHATERLRAAVAFVREQTSDIATPAQDHTPQPRHTPASADNEP